MLLNIRDKEYELNFGVGFLRELDKKYFVTRNGEKFGASMDLKIPLLLTGDIVTLSDILYAGMHALKSRPNQSDIDKYIDEVEDVEAFLEEVFDELKKSNATKMQVTRILAALEAEKAEKTGVK